MAIAVQSEAGELRIPSLWQVVGGLIVGASFIAFSIPNALVRFGHILGWTWVSAIGATSNGILDDVAGATASSQFMSFGYLRSALVIGLLAYLAALALLSLRHQQLGLFVAGAVSLVIGTALLSILAWFVYLIALLLILISIIVAWVFSILGVIFRAIFSFFALIFGFVAQFFEFMWGLLVRFWAFLISSPWWILAAVLILALVIFLAVRFREALWQMIVSTVWIAIVIGAFFLLRWLLVVLAPLWAFLARVFTAIFQFLAMIVRFLIPIVTFLGAFLLVGYFVYGVGAWVMDLFRGAWSSGNGRRGIIIGALAIGTMLAFILLETNLYHTNAFPYYPLQAVGLANYFHQVSPIFDMIVALLVVAVSILGVLRNLPQLQKEPDWAEFQSAMVMAGLGIMIVVVLYVIGSMAGGSSQN